MCCPIPSLCILIPEKKKRGQDKKNGLGQEGQETELPNCLLYLCTHLCTSLPHPSRLCLPPPLPLPAHHYPNTFLLPLATPPCPSHTLQEAGRKKEKNQPVLQAHHLTPPSGCRLSTSHCFSGMGDGKHWHLGMTCHGGTLPPWPCLCHYFPLLSLVCAGKEGFGLCVSVNCL